MHDITAKESPFIVSGDTERSFPSVPRKETGGFVIGNLKFPTQTAFKFPHLPISNNNRNDGSSSRLPRYSVPKIHRRSPHAAKHPNRPNPSPSLDRPARLAIPLPDHHIRRTESELQLWEEKVRAEHIDRAFYYRCYSRRASLQADEEPKNGGGAAVNAVTPPARRASEPPVGAEDWAVSDDYGCFPSGGDGGWPFCPATQRGILRHCTIGSGNAERTGRRHHVHVMESCDDDEVFLIEDL